MTKYRVSHTTIYEYEYPVTICFNELRMVPRSTSVQELVDHHILIDPQPSYIRSRNDFFGNQVTFFSLHQQHQELKVTVESEIVLLTEDKSSLSFSDDMPWEQVIEATCIYSPDYLTARPYALSSSMIPIMDELRDYALPSFPPNRPMMEGVQHLMERIFQEFEFDPEFTTIATPILDVLAAKKGVCQDFAHLGIGCLRALGLPARYVSGYIETIPPEGTEKLEGADASHAWFSAYSPKMGWIEFDPTNNLIPADQHLTVAWGRDYADVAPLNGVIYGGQEQKLDVAVDVTRI